MRHSRGDYLRSRTGRNGGRRVRWSWKSAGVLLHKPGVRRQGGGSKTGKGRREQERPPQQELEKQKRKAVVEVGLTAAALVERECRRRRIEEDGSHELQVTWSKTGYY